MGKKTEPDDIRTLGVELSADPLERMIVKYIYGLRAERRLYPDSYAADFAAAIRHEIIYGENWEPIP